MFTGRTKDRRRAGTQRPFEASIGSGLGSQAGVFGQQGHVGTRGQVTGQGAAHAVRADPALAAGAFDHIQRAPTVQPQALKIQLR